MTTEVSRAWTRLRSAGPVTNCAVALLYASYGVRVFPCRETDKSPYTAHGMLDASANEEQIRTWWAAWPNAVVGLPCRANGIIAIDADRHGEGDGVLTLLRMFAEHRFDVAAHAEIFTPRDGRHYVFRLPNGLQDTKGTIVQAIDVKDNGYVIAAGSTMADGRRYSLQRRTIEEFASAIGHAVLPELPLWLEEMVAKPKGGQARDLRNIFRMDVYRAGVVDLKLKALARKVVQSTPGNRNNTLHWAACRAGELVGMRLIAEQIAVEFFTEAGCLAGLSRREARSTARSGVAAGRLGLVR